MFELQPLSIEVPVQYEASEEAREIVRGLAIGGAIRETAMFRIWRMWRDKSYLDIMSDNPETPDRMMFPTFTEFIQVLCEQLEVSRSKIYNRIRAYTQLDYLGFGDDSKLLLMSTRPGLYEKALNLIFVWDQDTQEPTAYKTDAFGDIMDEDSLVRVKRFIEELSDHESVQDALSYLKHDIMGRPEITLIFDKGAQNFKIEYTSMVLSEDGDESTSYYNTWEPGSELPDWVVSEINKRYHVKVY